MKYIACSIIMLAWFFVTLMLSITIVGIIVVVDDVWLLIPKQVFEIMEKS